MANKLYEETSIQDIANAIREKNRSTDTYKVAEMGVAIRQINGLDSNIVEFSQMNDLVSAYLNDADVQYTDDNGDSVSVIRSYAKTTEGNEDFPNKITVTLSKEGNTYLQNEEDGKGRMLPIYTGNKCYIRNEIPNKIYQYISKQSNGNLLDNGRVKPLGKIRMIEFTGYMRNFRDLGGWNCDGGTVNYGLIYRSAVASNLHNFDVQRVKDMGIRHHIDFRGDEESNNLSESPLGSDIRFHRIPIGGSYVTMINTAQTDYENTKKVFRIIIDAIIHNESVTYNCSLGRDRTGTVTFMLLALLGVSRADIDKDYELSSFSSVGNYPALRTSTSYREVATYLATLGGSTLRDNAVWWFIKAGFSIDELNAFRNAMIDGTPTQLNSDDYITTYSIVNNLTGCTTSNSASSVYEGNSYSAILTMTGNNNTWKSVVVTMGGIDITSTVYSDGTISIENVTGDIVITAEAEYIAPYTNQIPLSINSDGTAYNSGQGWKTGYKLNAGTGAEEEKSSYEVTGFIPVTYTDTIRIKNFTSESGVGYNMMLFFDSSFAVVGAFTANSSYNPLSQFIQSDGSIEACISSASTTNFTDTKKTSIAYMRLSFKEINSTTICTINEEII